jgi:cell division protein FtsL
MEINPSLVLSLALATVPTMLTVLIGILINNSRLGDVNSRINDLRSHMDSRFDEMRATWH